MRTKCTSGMDITGVPADDFLGLVLTCCKGADAVPADDFLVFTCSMGAESESLSDVES